MKQTKKEILKKYDLFGDPERIWADDAEKAMQEYADLFYKEKLREELMEFVKQFYTQAEVCEYYVDEYLTPKE